MDEERLESSTEVAERMKLSDRFAAIEKQKLEEMASTSSTDKERLEANNPSTSSKQPDIQTEKSGDNSASSETLNLAAKPRISYSPTSFLDYSDDDSDDDDDDDDLLHTAPVFLKSIEDIANLPSPQPLSDHNINFNSSIDSASSSPIAQRDTTSKQTSRKSKLCLDKLLIEHAGQAGHVKDYNELKTELKTEGGFVNILNKGEETSVEDVVLKEDQEQILKQINEGDSELPEDRPGVNVFDMDQYGCMYDKSLHPCQCGFIAGENGSTMEKHIQSLTPDRYMMLVESDMLILCFSKIVCQSQLLRWLFFIMSVDDNFLLRQFCNKSLLNILHQQRTNGQPIWSPSITDFITVLCNFGASLDALLPQKLETLFNKETLRSDLLKQSKTTRTDVNRKCIKEDDVKEQFKMVLQVTALSLRENRGVHSPKDLTLYLAVLCKVALDPFFKNLYAITSFQECINMVIQNYTDTDWEHGRIPVCRVLKEISTHHHDMVYIVRLLPEGARGVYLQRRVSYLMLTSLLLEEEITDTQLHNLQIRDLYQFVPVMMTLLLDDLYKLSSVIALIDNTVASNYSLTPTDREELKQLIDLMKKIKVKDNVALINRTKVKDMLVRVTNIWSLDLLQTYKGKQTKIFEYADYKSPIKMKIEKIERQSSYSSEESVSDDEQDVPCKVPKLS